MAEMKTKPMETSPADFINQIKDDRKRDDCNELVAVMSNITGKPAKMWGPSIVGFGKYRYRYATGREGEAPMTGFSPRRQNLTLYLGPGLDNNALLAKLGKYKRGQGCLYIRKLDDVDRLALRDLIRKSVDEMRKRYECE